MKRFRWITILISILYLKEFLFTLFISFDNGIYAINGVGINVFLTIAHLAILGIVIFPYLMFKGKNSLKYLIIVDIIYTALLISDLWVYRGTGHLLELKFLFFNEGFYTLNKGIINPKIRDVLLVIDIGILLFYYRELSNKINNIRRVRLSLSLIGLCFIIIGAYHYIFDIKEVSNGKVRFMQEDWHRR